VTADSLYEAVAQGLRAFRESDWVDDVGGGMTTITVVVRHPGVEHKVRVRDFEQWLETQGRRPAEMSLKNRLRELVRKPREALYMESRSERRAAQKGGAEIGHFIEPMACLAVANLPAGSDWEYALKLDGYRAIAFKTRGRVHLRSRNGKDFSERFWSLIRPSNHSLTRRLSTGR
jgi:ATP-dependent DNA ligase